MTRKIVGYLLIATAIIIGVLQFKRYIIAPDLTLREFDLYETDGNTPFKIQANNGTYTVICFFTTWCGSCHQEFGSIQKGTELGLLNNFKFIAITDESIDKLNKYLNTYSYNSIQFKYSRKSMSQYGIKAFPTVYIFDKQGKMLYSHIGIVNWQDTNWLQQFVMHNAPQANILAEKVSGLNFIQTKDLKPKELESLIYAYKRFLRLVVNL